MRDPLKQAREDFFGGLHGNVKEVKMFPRNSSEGQVSRMGGQLPWMGGPSAWGPGKQEQRQFGRGGADRRQRRPPWMRLQVPLPFTGRFPGTDMDLGSLASREKA